MTDDDLQQSVEGRIAARFAEYAAEAWAEGNYYHANQYATLAFAVMTYAEPPPERARS